MSAVEEWIRSRPEFEGAQPNQRGKVLVRCPFHDDRKPSFQLSVQTGLFICRAASCGVRGGLAKLYRLLERRGLPDALRREVSGLSVGPMPVEDNPFVLPDAPEPEVWVPPPYPLGVADPWSVPQAAAYLEGRRIGRETSQAFCLRLGTVGTSRWRIICPYYDLGGEYLTWTGRYIFERGALRYWSPDGGQNGDRLYGEHMFHDAPLFVVEGPFDVLRLHTLGVQALGLGGARATPAQVVRLSALHAIFPHRPVVVLLDQGAEQAVERLCNDLWLHGIRPRGLTADQLGAQDPGKIDFLPRNFLDSLSGM